jgi:DNA-binding CsgD family transcriptional regulator
MESRRNQAPVLLLRATALHRAEVGGFGALPVRPLPEDVMGRLARAWCDGVAEDSDSFAPSIAVAAEGRPGVLRAMVDRLIRQGTPPGEDAAAAADLVEQVLAQRAEQVLDSLCADGLSLARAMAVCGQDGAFELAAALAGPFDGSAQGALDDLVSLGLARSDAADRPALAGDAVALRVLGAMAAADRSALARRAAELGHRSALPDDRLAELIMRAPPLRARWAEDVLCRVAVRRRTDGDTRSAAALLTRALADNPPVRRPELLIELALSEVSTRPLGADLRLQELLGDATLLATPGELVRAADLLQCRGDARAAHRSIAMACQRLAGPEALALAAIGWLAVQDSETDPILPVPPLPQLDDLPERRASRPAADPTVVSIAEPVLAGVLAWRLAAQGRRRDQVRALAMTALRPADAMTATTPFMPRICACRALRLAGDTAAAMRGLDQVLLDARQVGAGMAAALARMERAACELARSRPGRALDELEAARREQPLASWHPRLAPWPVALEASSQLAAGDIEAAERALNADLPPEAADGVAWAHLEYARGNLHLALADPEAALPSFLACGRALTSRGITNPAVAHWRAMAATAHAALGDRAAAAALVQDAADRVHAWGEPLTTALVHQQAVRSGCGAITLPLVETTAPPPDARHHAAHDTGDGASHHPVDRNPANEPPPLSADEERIARLAVAGWSNVDIARFLSVSTRTVEARLTAIYRRLELTGRKQLAEMFPPV